MGKAELRIQHSFPGACTGTLGRSARAEGQASAQVQLIAVCYMEPSAWRGIQKIVKGRKSLQDDQEDLLSIESKQIYC